MVRNMRRGHNGAFKAKVALEAIYPKPRLSLSNQAHKKYPYLMSTLAIDHPDQGWCADITYIRMLLHGFVYLVAIMDWYSRFVVAWEISTTLDTPFRISALEQALELSKPEIFNTDQGSQFTSLEFTERLEQEAILISMDGRGRVNDNIFIERLSGLSSTRKSISITTRRSLRLVMAWPNTSFSTIWNDFISPWGIKPLMRYMSKIE
jgi:transposase InsO family protein